MKSVGVLRAVILSECFFINLTTSCLTKGRTTTFLLNPAGAAPGVSVSPPADPGDALARISTSNHVPPIAAFLVNPGSAAPGVSVSPATDPGNAPARIPAINYVPSPAAFLANPVGAAPGANFSSAADPGNALARTPASNHVPSSYIPTSKNPGKRNDRHAPDHDNAAPTKKQKRASRPPPNTHLPSSSDPPMVPSPSFSRPHPVLNSSTSSSPPTPIPANASTNPFRAYSHATTTGVASGDSARRDIKPIPRSMHSAEQYNTQQSAAPGESAIVSPRSQPPSA